MWFVLPIFVLSLPPPLLLCNDTCMFLFIGGPTSEDSGAIQEEPRAHGGKGKGKEEGEREGEGKGVFTASESQEAAPGQGEAASAGLTGFFTEFASAVQTTVEFM